MQPSNSAGPGPEVVERQRVAKERAAQSPLLVSAKYNEKGPGKHGRRRCMKDTRF